MTIKIKIEKSSNFEISMQKTVSSVTGAVGRTSFAIGIIAMISLSVGVIDLASIDAAEAAPYRSYSYEKSIYTLRPSNHVSITQTGVCADHPGRCRGYKRITQNPELSKFGFFRNQLDSHHTTIKDRIVTGSIPPVRKIRTHGKINAPLGLQIFCMKQPNHCRGGGVSQLQMTASLMRTLSRTNAKVNRSIRPRLDKNGDVWSINVKAGDCEDYVLSKRSKLIALGIAASSLRIATAYTRQGIGHAVLVVRTNEGDYVLDNRRRAIKKWHQTGLRGVSLSGANLRNWKKFSS